MFHDPVFYILNTIDQTGNISLLTDPQIMTHSSVSEGKDMFGGGNIEKAVSEFERHHVCNEFCKWPGFGLKTLGGGLAVVKALGEGLGVA